MSLLLSFLGPFLWIIYFFRKDKHPEPASWLFVTFLLGIFSAILSYFTEGIIVSLKENQNLYFFLSALIEEFFKFLVVFLLIFPQKVFDEPIDAMIYMMFSAFGFAFVENLSVFLMMTEGESIFILALVRFLGANFLHILASSLIGYGYGYLKITRRIFPFLISFLGGVGLHFFYNLFIINNVLGFLYVLPILWSIFFVVLSELNYLILINERGTRAKN